MSPGVKPRRHYDASRRRAQAQATRAAVLRVARDLFLDQGYVATTVAAIAAQAGVSVETIYKTFAGKAGLLKAVFDVSVAGDDEPVAMDQREVIRAVIREPDAVRKIRLYVTHLVDTVPRAAPIQLLARDAAAADPDAAEVWAQMRAEVLSAMTLFARDLASSGQLAGSVAHARDVLWLYHAPELYELLVLERGWSARRYGAFVAEAMIGALVRAPKPGRG
jgi:AcrR family transcriptional regulator